MTRRVSISKSITQGESLSQFYQRVRNGGARKPLRSLRELAEEFGVPHKTLQAKLARCKGAPKPIYSTGDHKTAPQRNTWYDPQEVRRWWAAMSKEQGGQAMTGRQTTHAPGCWDWGPKHYECALKEIEALRTMLQSAFRRGYRYAAAGKGIDAPQPQLKQGGVAFPEGYEIHELPADYTGPVWIEGQVRSLYRKATGESE